jgi:cysteinyl-tRNA synthetase
MYSCGPAAGGPAGLGELRSLLLPDLIRRVAERQRLRVITCQPSTDPAARAGTATQPGRAVDEDTVVAALRADGAALNFRPPDVAPRLDASGAEIIALIGKLIETKDARASGGTVTFDASTGPGPGLREGWPLWVPAAAGTVSGPGPAGPGPAGPLPAWPSPWGPGRPGPDVACSALSLAHLGEVIDIHTGGRDLASPHHEHVRAQSGAATGHEVTRHWAHSAPVAFGDDAGRLSSLAGRGLDPLALRLALLGHRYRAELELTWDGLASAGAELARWRGQVADWARSPSRPISAGYNREVTAAFDDDLDTPAALRALRRLADDPAVPPGSKFETFADADRLLGLDLAQDVGRFG